MNYLRYLIFVVFIFSKSLSLFGQELCNFNINIGSFNIAIGKADINVIQKQLAENPEIKIWGIVESNNKVVNNIKATLKKIGDYDVITGTTGVPNNKMQIYYDDSIFKPIYHTELHYINYKNRVRSPLVVKFKDLRSNEHFYVMLNHLYRSNNQYRHKQAELLNKWVLELRNKENTPVIAIGDYNFDMYYKDISKRDLGFDKMTHNELFKWVKPNVLFPTQCSKYKSILDFVFISDNIERRLKANSDILYLDNEYCSYKNYFSDHRPIVANIIYESKCK